MRSKAVAKTLATRARLPSTVNSDVRRLGRHKMTASLLKPESPAEWREARRLVEETTSLNLDLSFQAARAGAFERVFSAVWRFAGARKWVGLRGARMLSDTVGEIKRLYVEPTARGLGLGQALVRGIVEEGKQLEYTRLVLDTLPSMLAARLLYQALGFKPVAPYRYNPVSGTVFLELRCRIKEPSTVRPRADGPPAPCPRRHSPAAEQNLDANGRAVQHASVVHFSLMLMTIILSRTGGKPGCIIPRRTDSWFTFLVATKRGKPDFEGVIKIRSKETSRSI